MSEENNDIQVTITALTKAPSRKGFGTACVMAYHTHWPERTRVYSSVTGMTDDGFEVDEPATLLAGRLFGQTPNSVQSIVIGREILTDTKDIKITPILAELEDGAIYTMYVNGVACTTTAMVTPATVEDCCDKLKIAIDAEGFTGMTVTDNITDLDITVATAANNPYLYTPSFRALTIKDNTTDGGIATDIAAVINDRNDWYELHLTDQNAASVTAASNYIQTLSNTNKKRLRVTSQDSEVLAGTGIALTLKTAGNTRTDVSYHYRANDQYMAAAWSGNILPLDPGKSTYKFWELALCDVMALTDTEITNLKATNCNYYVEVGGYGSTRQGVACDGEFIDITRDTDFIVARIQEGISRLLSQSNKVTYDDDGGTALQAEVDAVMRLGVTNTIFRRDPAPTTSVPLVATIDTTDRELRHFPDVKFNAQYAGAVHSVGVSGTVSV